MRLAPLLLLLTLAAPVQADLITGFNQAWIEGKFGRDLTSAFDEAEWRRALERTREGGGKVLRLWLFEGKAKEGILYHHAVPTGVDPALLANVRRVQTLARELRVKLLWCVFDGNWFEHYGRGDLDHHRHFNVLMDRYGAGAALEQKVLAPLIDVLAEMPDVVFGLDLMNEVQGSVKTWMWSDGWTGARRWIARTARFCHARAPWLKVTASSGHHRAVKDVIDGRFDGLGLDLYDVHLYTDGTTIPDGARLAAHGRARGVPVIVGEIGQSKTADDPALQARVLEGILSDAARLGLRGVLAWRLEDRQANGRQFTFFEPDGRARPALAVMRRHGGAYPLPASGIAARLGD